MSPVRYVLVAEGSSDRMLLPVIDWTLRQLGAGVSERKHADFRLLPRSPRTLAEKLIGAKQLYPEHLLIVHRDANGAGRPARLAEIRAAAENVPAGCVPLIPERMTEAWFLHNEAAIRRAAGNPNGSVALALPAPRVVENLPDPKEDLYRALEKATELSGRRLERWKRERSQARQRVAELTEDHGALRELAAYRAFCAELEKVLGA